MSSLKQTQIAQKRRRLIFNAVRDAALAGLPCPTNDELTDLCGYACIWSAARTLQDFQREGLIRLESRGPSRVVVSLHHGWRTAERPRRQEIAKPRTRVAQFVDHAADIFNTTSKDILSTSQFKEHVIARRAISLAAFRHGWGVCSIARVLNRDHTTIAYTHKIAAQVEQSDPVFCAKLAELVARTEVAA